MLLTATALDLLYLAGGDFGFADRPSRRYKKNVTEGKEADLATAFDRPSFLTQRVRLETMRAGCSISTAEIMHLCCGFEVCTAV
jgi:hypothetical protein